MNPALEVLEEWLGALSSPTFPPWLANGATDPTHVLSCLGFTVMSQTREYALKFATDTGFENQDDFHSWALHAHRLQLLTFAFQESEVDQRLRDACRMVASTFHLEPDDLHSRVFERTLQAYDNDNDIALATKPGFIAYLASIPRSAAIDVCRAERKHQVGRHSLPSTDFLLAASEHPGDALVFHELELRFRQFVGDLPVEDQVLIRLLRERVSPGEIRQILGLNSSALSMRTRRLRAKLDQLLHS